jgi:hypothetical protein
VVTSNLNVLGSGSDLIHALGLNVGNLFSTIKFISDLFEILFHHIDIFFVVLFIDTGVANHADAVLVKALGNFHGL